MAIHGMVIAVVPTVRGSPFNAPIIRTSRLTALETNLPTGRLGKTI
jgi:hypothetical protein